VRASLGLDPADPLLVTVARLAPQKALGVMLEAVGKLRPPAHLVVVGDGPLREELIRAADDMGVAPRVSFLGWRDDVAEFVAAADVFCLSSIWEGVPIAAMEAILLGVPIVSTDVGGMRELVPDEDTGRLVPTGDADALAREIETLLRSERTRKEIAGAARTHLDREFSTERMLARLASIYRELAGA
jgi:glycosyltransferase involved in cell wall biosynthesis